MNLSRDRAELDILREHDARLEASQAEARAQFRVAGDPARLTELGKITVERSLVLKKIAEFTLVRNPIMV